MVWDNLLSRFCLTELAICSSSSLMIRSIIHTQTIVTVLYLASWLVVYLVRTSAFVPFGVMIKGFCFKTGVFFGVCSRIQNEMQALY